MVHLNHREHFHLSKSDMDTLYVAYLKIRTFVIEMKHNQLEDGDHLFQLQGMDAVELTLTSVGLNSLLWLLNDRYPNSIYGDTIHEGLLIIRLTPEVVFIGCNTDELRLEIRQRIGKVIMHSAKVAYFSDLSIDTLVKPDLTVLQIAYDTILDLDITIHQL